MVLCLCHVHRRRRRHHSSRHQQGHCGGSVGDERKVHEIRKAVKIVAIYIAVMKFVKLCREPGEKNKKKKKS